MVEWKAISNGLPESRGTIIAILAANPKNSGEFYAINNRGVFCSTDTGLVWRDDSMYSRYTRTNCNWHLN